jgi:mercuric ion transport protein
VKSKAGGSWRREFFDGEKEQGMKEPTTLLGAIGAAVAASACCLGPLALAGLGAGTVAAAQQLELLRPLFLALTFLFLGFGFYLAYRKPKQAACEGEVCEQPRAARWGRPLLWVVTVFVLALVAFPYYYGPLRGAAEGERANTANFADADELSTAELRIEGMTCSGCALGVRQTLLQKAGVRQAEVDFDSARARVRYDAAAVSVAELVAAVEGAGFRAVPIAPPGEMR